MLRSLRVIGAQGAAAVGVIAMVPMAAAAHAQPECGTVRLPNDAVRPVTIASGALTCDEALSVVERYLRDPNLARSGNTQSAEFLGWVCASPTATASEIYGYSLACQRGGDEIRVLN